MIASVRTSKVRAVGQNQATSQAELAIQPRVEQWSAIDLNPELLPAISTGVRSWLERETRRNQYVSQGFGRA